MGNRYRCIKEHFTDKEHNGKACPYDNLSTEELENLSKKEIKKVKYVDIALKNHYEWAVSNGKLSPLVSFKEYIETYISLRDIAIGKVAADGTKVRHISKHCIDRVCGTTEKEGGVKHEGVSLQDFEETLFKGKVKFATQKNQNKIYLVGKCVISIDCQKGEIIQCNKIK